MDAGSTAWLSALWLGVLTSISPCPLAANIAAVSYVARTLGVSIRTLPVAPKIDPSLCCWFCMSLIEVFPISVDMQSRSIASVP